jgi:hypothetical protein
MGCGKTILVGEGGMLTCSYIHCKDPGAIHRMAAGEGYLHAGTGNVEPPPHGMSIVPGPVSQQTAVLKLIERCACEHGRWSHAEGKGRCFASNCPCQAFVANGEETPVAPEVIRLSTRFIEGAQMLEQAGEDRGEKARRRAQRLADSMRLQALTVALGLEEPRG